MFTKDILLQWYLCRSRDISIEHTCAYLNSEKLLRFSVFTGETYVVQAANLLAE